MSIHSALEGKEYLLEFTKNGLKPKKTYVAGPFHGLAKEALRLALQHEETERKSWLQWGYGLGLMQLDSSSDHYLEQVEPPSQDDIDASMRAFENGDVSQLWLMMRLGLIPESATRPTMKAIEAIIHATM